VERHLLVGRVLCPRHLLNFLLILGSRGIQTLLASAHRLISESVKTRAMFFATTQSTPLSPPSSTPFHPNFPLKMMNIGIFLTGIVDAV